MLTIMPSICPACQKEKASLASCFKMISGIPFNICDDCLTNVNSLTQEQLLRIGFRAGFYSARIQYQNATHSITEPKL